MYYKVREIMLHSLHTTIKIFVFKTKSWAHIFCLGHFIIASQVFCFQVYEVKGEEEKEID